jgi:acyl-homoserine lactone acylase PvdQ
MDIDTRREGYTEQEIKRMFDSLDEKFGPDGRAVQEGLVAYSDGVNAYIDQLKTDPTVSRLSGRVQGDPRALSRVTGTMGTGGHAVPRRASARAERLCNPTGEVTETSNFYRFKGRCRRMSSREETFVVRPTPISPGIRRTETRAFDRTIHGPVFARGTVDGKPVAFVKERFFWKKEIDSVPQFYRWNTRVDSLADFRSAARDFTMSFNAFYADSEDIAYFHVGYYPRRERGVHPSLPIWGTGRWEWEGRFPRRRHPKVVNPDQGWMANWNNKPAYGWDNFDNFKFGSIHRVELLQDRMRELLDGPAQRSCRTSSTSSAMEPLGTRAPYTSVAG